MADLTPNDIVNKEFRRVLRGYDTEQVDDFLQQVSDQLYRALEENQRMRGQLDDLRAQVQRYQQTEDLIKNALVLAERTAEDVRQHAHEQAALIRREAEEHIRTERAQLEEARQARLRTLSELRSVLQAQLTLLDSQEGRLSSPPPGEGMGY
jgi:cell division initiation protein